jgi:hypothetical protein
MAVFDKRMPKDAGILKQIVQIKNKHLLEDFSQDINQHLW